MQHRIIALIIPLALQGLAASAQDGSAQDGSAQDGGGLRTVFGLSERLEASQNPGLSIPAGDSTLSSVTSLSFGLTSSTPTEVLSLALNGGLRLSQTGGDSLITGIDGPQLSFGYDRSGANAAFAASLDYSDARIETLRPLTDFINDQGEIEFPTNPDDLVGTGTRRASGASLRLDLGSEAPLGFTLQAGFDQTDYADVSDPDLVDSRGLDLGATAQLQFSDSLSGDVTLSQDRFETEDAAATSLVTQGLDIGINHEISPTFSVSAGAGLSLVQTEAFGTETRSENATARAGLNLALPQGSLAVDIGLDSAEIAWQQSLPRGSIGAALSQIANADGSGTTSVAALSYSQSLSAVSGISLGLSYSDFSDPGENDVTRTDLSASYTHSLSADWGMTVGANYSLRDEDTVGAATSSTLSLSLSRNFEF